MKNEKVHLKPQNVKHRPEVLKDISLKYTENFRVLLNKDQPLLELLGSLQFM